MKPIITKQAPKELDNLIKALESKMFKALTDPTRTQILKFLMLNGRTDISTIANQFPQDRSVISRHLHMMDEAELLIAEKETRHRFYSINGERVLSEFESIVTNLKACIHECCPSTQ